MVTDGVLGGLGIVAFFIQGVTLLTALGGLLLITIRVAIAVQEYRLNHIKLKTPKPEMTNESGT